MNGDTANTVLLIDDVEQTISSMTTTAIEFYLDGVTGTSASTIDIYLADGIPTGAASIVSLDYTKALVSISAQVGSSAGSQLTVTGTGFGTDTTDVNLYYQEGAVNLCDTVEVTAYGTFTCNTIEMEVPDGATLQLVVDGSTYDCLNTLSASECTYKAITADSPSLSAVTLTDSTTVTANTSPGSILGSV